MATSEAARIYTPLTDATSAVRIARDALAASEAALPPYSGRFSWRDYTLRALVAPASPRGFVGALTEDFPSFSQTLGLSAARRGLCPALFWGRRAGDQETSLGRLGAVQRREKRRDEAIRSVPCGRFRAGHAPGHAARRRNLPVCAIVPRSSLDLQEHDSSSGGKGDLVGDKARRSASWVR
jgi:hypothetical protein